MNPSGMLPLPEVQPCRSALHAAVRAFRVGMEAQGNDHLIAFVNHLAEVLSAARHKPPDGAGKEHLPPQAEILPFLETALAAQERGDFLFVADLLEYEIAPRL